ncbi:MAG: glycosyl transferase family 2, partial [Bacteroidetes bacterium HGW-Bacteroidetes-14]
RNNLLMLYKNLSGGWLVPVMFARMIMDGLSAVVYLLQGKHGFFRAVLNAHRDFYEMRTKTARTKRAENANPKGVYKGLIVLSFLLRLGRPKFVDIAPDVKR